MIVRRCLKRLLFPGLNLHARQRYRVLPQFFGIPRAGETRWLLDAGCGNGMLAYRAWRRGFRVIGISIKEGEIERARRFFNVERGIPEDQLTFRVHNLYNLGALGMTFDEIVCSEVLEHLARDADAIRGFAAALNPNGILHLCAPNAEHPDNRSKALDPDEHGGHVRPGYTMESYRRLLEPAGFEIVASRGLGGPLRQFCNKRIIRAQGGGRPLLAVAWFVLGWTLSAFDPRHPTVPYSLYVKGIKRTGPAAQ